MPDTTDNAIRDTILDRKIVIGQGVNRQDKNFKNISCTVEELFAYLNAPRVGAKDGACILSGEVVGGQRLATNMKTNYILMLDIDNGMSINDAVELVKRRGLCAVIWTTYSHLKTTSVVKEAALHQFLNKRGQNLDFELDEITGQIADYLAKEKNYTADILNSIFFDKTKRQHVAGGVEYVITHAPMPRFRVLFILEEPFSFSKGLQKDRIKAWKDGYKSFCEDLGIVHDASCEDPSRLMYTPAIANIEAPFEIRYIDGEALNLNTYAPKNNTFLNNPNTSSRIPDNNTQARMYMPETPGLRAFVKAAPDFDIVGFVNHMIPDHIRGPAAQGQGVCLRCPNEDAHSNVDLEDKAFFVSTSANGWYAGCLHATCKDASGNDRLWYLDRMCVEYGWTVDDLAPFSAQYQATLTEKIKEHVKVEWEKDNEATFWQKVKDNILAVTDTIDSIDPDDEEGVIFACAVITQCSLIQQDRLLNQLVEATGISKSAVKTLFKAQKERYEAFTKSTTTTDDDNTNTSVVVSVPPPPADLSEVTVIYKNWAPNDQCAAVLAVLDRVNKRKQPAVYRTSMGELCLIMEVAEKTLIRNIDATGLQNVVRKNVGYKSVNTQTGTVHDIVPEKTVISMIATDSELNFPILKSTSAIPIFGQDGSLQTEKGYVPSICTYLNVKEGDWLPVSENVTTEELVKAWDIILEAIRDFPFSDDFTGSDDEPIKLDELDEDGFPLPNLDRGASSRMNAVAMILQRFARFMIKGPCPAYFIDKAEAGTGAGYLTNVMACPITGQMATGVVMASSDDEFRKNITASIISGEPYVFVDNIDRTITSTAFAILLTSGRWRDRILGQSAQTDIEVDSTWVLTGNNAGFTFELSRRFVPIRLDANVPNPAFERGPKDFKHTDHPQWLKDKRQDMVWAALTIIRAWVNAGMVLASAYKDTGVTIDGETHNVDHMTINSFDAYANVMGGIFITSALLLNSHYPLQFLANREGFSDTTQDDTREEDAAVQDMFSMFGFDTAFQSRDLFNRATDPMTTKLKDVYPVSGRDDADTIKKLGNWLGKKISKRTFNVQDATDNTLNVKLVKVGKGTNTRKYQFVPTSRV